ncbi:hypothetical protein L3X37_02285 [Sabulilitoribacter arenilitoris]|uniref:Cytochrome C Planctomycete-type domain-containing protein n=2 Tax=Wocania arenilitoris TaxID=2044858 RepID=A0AAE3EKX3_9FLAO|nr:c-type cytochrome domain-containing protein [Wocania arenilitoris]MCF7567193.1 hypothetical protein [Wocania arenilitoris]
MELLSCFSKKNHKVLKTGIYIALIAGGFGALLSALMGYLISQQGGYDDKTLFWHQWLGIALALLSFLGWGIKSNRLSFRFLKSRAIIVLLVVLMFITGHLGGNLTHGSDYLTAYAPNFVKKILGYEASYPLIIPKSLDSVRVFDHLIQPILNAKCVQCHGENKVNGGLKLSSIESISKGGEGGAVIVKGQPYESELLLRCTLPQEHKKFMPPKGTPLSFSEMKLLEWWILQGASTDMKLTTTIVPTEIHQFLMRDFGVDTKTKPFYDRIQVPPIEEDLLLEFSNVGWKATRLSVNHQLLNVKLFSDSLSIKHLEVLQKAKDHVFCLDLSGIRTLTDDMVKVVVQLPHITHLKVEKTGIKDSGVKLLVGLQHLEVLNLYGTSVTNESLMAISDIPSLKRVYLWNTKVTPESIVNFHELNPKIEVIGIEYDHQIKD